MGSFSDGLAWVSRDGNGGWFAIDKANRVVIQSGFDDVRPFRRGIAIVRQRRQVGRGREERPARGAVRVRRVRHRAAPTAGTSTASPTRAWPSSRSAAARAWSTAPAGCWCRRPTRPLVIHPVAFLFTDPDQPLGRDRTATGQPLIEPVHAEPRWRSTDELDQLLADTRPVL